jgi:hypothetical protein
MANYLLSHQVEGAERSHGYGAKKIGRAERLQQSFERAFERLRAAYVGLLRLALQHRRIAVAVFLLLPLLSFTLMPFLSHDRKHQLASGAALTTGLPENGGSLTAYRFLDQTEREIRGGTSYASSCAFSETGCDFALLRTIIAVTVFGRFGIGRFDPR